MADYEGTGPVVAELLTSQRAAEVVWTKPMLKVAAALRGLGVDYADFIRRVKERDAIGRKTYGHPLRPDTRKPNGTAYDWPEEAKDELVDALLYLMAAREVERGT